MYFAHVTSAGVVDWDYAPFGQTVYSNEQIKHMSIISNPSNAWLVYGCGYCPECADSNDKAIFSILKLTALSSSSALNVR